MGENRVPEGMECPNCGEKDADYLLISEDETVVCTNCKTVYQIEWSEGTATIRIISQS